MTNWGISTCGLANSHKGVPVWPAELSAHFDQAGSLILVDGAYGHTPELDSVKPALSGDDAVIRAQAGVAPGKNASQPAQLVVYGQVDHRPRLAWKFELTASLTEAWLFVVDAQDGTILHQSSRVCDTNVKGGGVDLFGTARTLNVWQNGKAYYMVDASKGSYDPAFDPIIDPHGVITVVDANGASPEQATSFKHDRYCHFPEHLEDPGHGQRCLQFFGDLRLLSKSSVATLRRSRAGTSQAIVRVENYDNASWNGNLRVMLFGEVEPYAGDLDVVAHEFTHAVTQNSADLIYQNQSGALNEAFSDIFGEMVEARTRGQNDWLQGSDFAEPIRNLKDPARFRHSRSAHILPR